MFIKINKCILLSIIAILAMSINSFSQDLKGKVYGVDAEGKISILPSATLQWLGTSAGTLSSADGNFSIKRHPTEKRLVVSYTGYHKDTLLIDDDIQSINVTLESELYFDEVNVTGTKKAQSISRSEIVKTEIISSRGLQKAACCNLSESFSTNPSIDVNYSDAVSGAKRIEMLGLDGIYSQIMTEKLPLMRGLAATYGLAYIPGTWMSQISISKGAASVADGYEAITGQINIDYKSRLENEPVFLNGFADQFGRIEGNFNGQYNLSDKTSTVLFAHASSMQTKLDENHDSFLNQPLLKTLSFMNKWQIDTDFSHHFFGVKALYEDRKAGQINFYPKMLDDKYGIGIKTKRLEAFAKNGFVFDTKTYNSVALILSSSFHDQASFFGKNSFIGNETNLYANLIYETKFGSNNEQNQSDNEGETHIQTALDENPIHDIKTGFSYVFDNTTQEFKGIDLRREERVPGIFGEYTYYGIENLILVAGFRADFHNLYKPFYTPRFFAKYNFTPFLSVRASVGKGYRVANILSENTGIMASSREIFIEGKLKPEEAWNYGLNMTYDFFWGAIPFTINAEVYRTDFTNQIIVDLETASNEAHFYNLNGESYSNSMQIDVNFEPLKQLDITAAYRLSDVYSTINNELFEPFYESMQL